MAHSNPEFALGLMRRETGPVRFQLDTKTATLADLRTRMAAIETRIEHIPGSVSAQEYAQLQLWRRVKRQDRATKRAAPDEPYLPPRGGMHAGGKSGERFTEPKRRYPADVQAGRTRVSAGTFSG